MTVLCLAAAALAKQRGVGVMFGRLLFASSHPISCPSAPSTYELPNSLHNPGAWLNTAGDAATHDDPHYRRFHEEHHAARLKAQRPLSSPSNKQADDVNSAMAGSMALAVGQANDKSPPDALIVLQNLMVIQATMELRTGGLRNLQLNKKMAGWGQARAAAISEEWMVMCLYSPRILLSETKSLLNNGALKVAAVGLPAPAECVSLEPMEGGGDCGRSVLVVGCGCSVLVLKLKEKKGELTFSVLCELAVASIPMHVGVEAVHNKHICAFVVLEAQPSQLDKNAPKGVVVHRLRVSRSHHAWQKIKLQASNPFSSEPECANLPDAAPAEAEAAEEDADAEASGDPKGVVLSCSEDLLAWGTPAKLVGVESPAHPCACAVVPHCDGLVAVGFSDGAIMIFQLHSPKTTKLMWPPVSYQQQASRTHNRSAVTSLEWHPEGGWLLVALADGSIRAHDCRTLPLELSGSIGRPGVLNGGAVAMHAMKFSNCIRHGRSIFKRSLKNYEVTDSDYKKSVGKDRSGLPTRGVPPHIVVVAALRAGPIATMSIAVKPQCVRGAGSGGHTVDTVRQLIEKGKWTTVIPMVEQTVDEEDYTGSLSVLCNALFKRPELGESEAYLMRLLAGTVNTKGGPALVGGKVPAHLQRCIEPGLVTKLQMQLIQRVMTMQRLDLAAQLCHICLEGDMHGIAMGQLHLWSGGGSNAPDEWKHHSTSGGNVALWDHSKAESSAAFKAARSSQWVDSFKLEALGLEHVDSRGINLEARAAFKQAEQMYLELGNLSAAMRVGYFTDLMEMPLTNATRGVATKQLKPLTRADVVAAQREQNAQRSLQSRESQRAAHQHGVLHHNTTTIARGVGGSFYR